MKTKHVVTALAISAAIICMCLMIVYAPARAQAQGSDSDISRKLDEIGKGQQAILQEMAAIRQELNIIKIRVTQSQ